MNFRLASTPRWQDATGTWKEGTTNWYTVKAYRRLAQNIATSIEKGQPLVVSGRQRISRWNREDGTQGTTVEVDALGIGHDLNYGTSTFARTVEKRTVNEGSLQVHPSRAHLSRVCRTRVRRCRRRLSTRSNILRRPHPSRTRRRRA